MCGRYQVSTEEEIIEVREIINEVNEKYKDKPLLASMTTGEIFPTNTAPILVAGESKPQAALMKWGFTRWDNKGVIINARAETAMEKKSFHASLLNRRCVIPTTGFYEWLKREGGKTKYLFRLSETKMLYLAGLYEQSPLGDPYVIMTTAANSTISSYHDRMPLILDKRSVEDWLSSTSYALDYISRPCEAALRATAV